MKYLNIKGNKISNGEVSISGAKNSILPLLACSLLGNNTFKFTNVPNVSDVNTMLKLLKHLGSNFDFIKNEITLHNQNVNHYDAKYDIVKTMRASVLVLGPLLARFGKAEVSLPGGCAIGSRPVDMHIQALECLGADISIEKGYIVAKTENGLIGSNIVFDKISVGATETAIMSASLAKGRTKIFNAAIEPEIIQLCNFLKNAGVNIYGVGESIIEIEGTEGELLNFTDECVISDRIEAGSYLCLGIANDIELKVKNINCDDLLPLLNVFNKMEAKYEVGDNYIKTLKRESELKPVNIVTGPHPSFPTDMQAQVMAMCLNIKGNSTIEETLFENRFMHVNELNRMGANIKTTGNVAFINGGQELNGCEVMATDLRASMAMIIAATLAKGETKINRIYHLERGYEYLEDKLNGLGIDCYIGQNSEKF